MAGIRRQRQEQFNGLADGAFVSLSTSLVLSAEQLLFAALQDRRGRVYRTPTDHYSHRAVGATGLLMAGFDVWMNEACGQLSNLGRREARTLVDRSIAEKFGALCDLVDAGDVAAIRRDLGLLAEIRHEILHYLPRPLGRVEGNVPPWLLELHRRGLLLSSGEQTDFVLGQKLGSYRLACFAVETCERAASTFVNALPEKDRMMFIAELFAIFQPPRFLSGDQLAEFDAEHGLEVARR